MENLFIHVGCVQLFIPNTNFFYSPLVTVKKHLKRPESEEEIKKLFIAEAKKLVPSEYSEVKYVSFSHI